jgi:riboflavin kinase / FMN adenylyltransferase
MRIFRHHTPLDKDARGAVVAVGNFDGLHLGHQAVIRTARDLADAAGAPQAVLTFEPHPRSVFQPAIPPFRLTPFRSKARWMEAFGVDLLFALHFDLGFAAIGAEDFVGKLLVEGLAVRHVVVGEDFVFGNKRRGNAALLRQEAARHGFGVTLVAPQAGANGQIYSSTRIRDFLAHGRPAEAAGLLGRDWEVEGRVEGGEKRGRLLGFPTANITLGEYLRPATGVYAVRAGLDRPGARGPETVWHDGVANLGVRPTFGGDGLVFEINIFDFAQDIYGQHLRVALVDYLRPEKKFDGIEQLKAQIALDSARARAILAGHAPLRPAALPTRPLQVSE